MERKILHLLLVFGLVGNMVKLNIPTRTSYPDLGEHDTFSFTYCYKGMDLTIDNHWYRNNEIFWLANNITERGDNLEDYMSLKLDFSSIGSDEYSVQVEFRFMNFTRNGSLIFNIDSYRYYNASISEKNGIYAPILIPMGEGRIPVCSVPGTVVYTHSEDFDNLWFENLAYSNLEQSTLYTGEANCFLAMYNAPYQFVNEDGYPNHGIMHICPIYNVRIYGGTFGDFTKMFLRTAGCNVPSIRTWALRYFLTRSSLDLLLPTAELPDEDGSNNLLILIVALGLGVPGILTFLYMHYRKKNFPPKKYHLTPRKKRHHSSPPSHPKI